MSNFALAAGFGQGDVDAVLVHIKPTYTLLVIDLLMARLLASSQRPGRPSARCIGVARQALCLQPTALQGRAALAYEAILFSHTPNPSHQRAAFGSR